MMQQWIVGAIVAYAFWVVAKRYLPRALHRLLRSWAVRGARRMGWNRLAARLEKRAEAGASCGDGCGSCGSCGSGEKDTAPKQFTIPVEALKRGAGRPH